MEAASSIPASGDNASEAEMSEARGAFLQSGYRALWTIRVSRYKLVKRLRISPGVVICLTAGARSGFASVQSPGLKAGSEAKTVTSFLIILSVLLVSALKVMDSKSVF